MREQNITVNNVQGVQTQFSWFWFAMLIGMIVLLWKWLLVGGLLAASGYCVWLAYRRRAQDAAAAAERADEQQNWFVQGDPRGIYGTDWNSGLDAIQPTMPNWLHDEQGSR